MMYAPDCADQGAEYQCFSVCLNGHAELFQYMHSQHSIKLQCIRPQS